jgi:hypothetical protein
MFPSPSGTPETGYTGNGYASITMKKSLLFRAKAYEPDDFTLLNAEYINASGDTIAMTRDTDFRVPYCTGCRNVSDTARGCI